VTSRFQNRPVCGSLSAQMYDGLDLPCGTAACDVTNGYIVYVFIHLNGLNGCNGSSNLIVTTYSKDGPFF